MLYSGKSYGVGDYVTICFFPGRTGSLIAREDSGRIILLERTTDMVVNPRDKVDCIVVHIKGAIQEDWTGRARSGFTIVRAIRVKEPYVEPVKMPTGHLPGVALRWPSCHS